MVLDVRSVTTTPHYTEVGSILVSDNLQLESKICFLTQAVVIYVAKEDCFSYALFCRIT